jgi:hypothetical protein
LSVSMTPCRPPELLAPAGTFELPGPLAGALQPATHNRRTHASSRELDEKNVRNGKGRMDI